MASRPGSKHPPIVLRTAALAREVLERAKTRKTDWPLPARFRKRSFQEGGRDPNLTATFAAVGEHLGHISERCENYYCRLSSYPYKDCEVAHILRYHASEAEELLKAIEAEENKASQNMEQPEDTSAQILAILPVDMAALQPTKTSEKLQPPETSNQKSLPFQAVLSASAPALPASSHIKDPILSSHIQAGSSAAGQTSDDNQDVFIEVSPGTYSVSASSTADKTKQTHVIKVQPGESVKLTFDL